MTEKLLLIRTQEQRDYLSHQADKLLRGGVSKATRQKRREFGKRLNEKKPKSEEWFKSILKKNGLLPVAKGHAAWASPRWCQNFSSANTCGFLIDFAFEALKVGIEVDEPSHEGRGVQDLARQGILEMESNGWKVYRVYFGDENRAFEIVQVLKRLKSSFRPVRNKRKN